MNETPNTSRESVPQIPMESTEQSLQELRARVAELCGRDMTCYRDHGRWWDHTNGLCPDYSNDLNACAKMEATLTQEQRDCCYGEIWKLIRALPVTNECQQIENGWLVYHATAEQRCRAFVAVIEASRTEATPSVPSPTEALTASGVSAKPDALRNWLKLQCSRMLYGQCSIRNCLVRGGWKADGSSTNYDLATCEPYEISVLLGEGSPGVSVPASPSPSPLVAVEEWTPIQDPAGGHDAWHIQDQFGVMKLWATEEKVVRLCQAHGASLGRRDASLASLTDEIERLKNRSLLHGPTKGWAVETMRIINKLVPEIEGQAFDPGWFLLRERLESVERDTASLTSRLEEETKIVDRVWKALGITTYEGANGKAIDELVSDLRASLAVAEAALIRLRDCDWVITPHDRMDAVREIARKALEKKEP